jgi:hypothetical protein
MSCPRAEDALRGIGDASHCAECAQNLKIFSLLGKATLPGPSDAALQRASAPILAELRPKLKRQWIAIAGFVSFIAPILYFRQRLGNEWAATLVVLAAALIVTASAGLAKAGAWVAIAASAAFAFAQGGVPGIVPAHAELGCFGIEMFAAALPLAAVLWMSRRNLSPGALAQAAAGGALAGQAALNLGCGLHNDAPHLWTIHVAGVCFAALLGWMLQRGLGYKSAVS